MLTLTFRSCLILHENIILFSFQILVNILLIYFFVDFIYFLSYTILFPFKTLNFFFNETLKYIYIYLQFSSLNRFTLNLKWLHFFFLFSLKKIFHKSYFLSTKLWYPAFLRCKSMLCLIYATLNFTFIIFFEFLFSKKRVVTCYP